MSLRAIFDVPAPAKLNLFLHVIGRRPDGYHLIQSAFVLIDWCDTLHFERRDDGLLRRRDLGPALPEDDLCLRAARALKLAGATSLGCDISIAKHVPWGAGMGGGSSDAASTLLALNRLWGLNWPLSRLLPIGLALGADVPFFLAGHNAWVEGIGERLFPLSIPSRRFAVLKPPASVETRAIFTSPELVRNTEAAILSGFLAGVGIEGLMQGYGRNDLQPPAMARCDEVAQAAELLRNRFGNSRMTGSGSAVFAVVAEDVAGKEAVSGTDRPSEAAWPADLPPGWVGRMCRSLEQHPLVGWAAGTG
jgi:4-diphosphocytidyl-2-C-methyl-D-erythritol kinase